MVRASKTTPPFSAHRIPRRRRQFIPSIAESASRLENRVLLSGAHQAAHAAEVAKPLADTSAGRRVTSLFESILHTTPTSQQLTQWVRKLHHGVSAKVLRKDLTAQARIQTAAGITAMAISHDPVISSPTVALSASSASVTGGISSFLPEGSSVQPITYTTGKITQVPVGMVISRAFTFPATPNSPISIVKTLTPTPSSTNISPTALTSLLDTINSDLSGTGTTGFLTSTSSSSTTLNSEVDSILTNSSEISLADTTSPTVISALNALLANPGLSASAATGTGSSLTPLLNSLLTNGTLIGTGATSLNPTTMGYLLNTVLINALNDLNSTATTPTTTTAATTATTTSPLSTLTASGSVPTPGSTTATTSSSTTASSILGMVI
jgi:hypothetical protein